MKNSKTSTATFDLRWPSNHSSLRFIDLAKDTPLRSGQSNDGGSTPHSLHAHSWQCGHT